jgi:hypothetical protein
MTPALPIPRDRGGFKKMYANLVARRTGGRLVSTTADGDDWLILRRPALAQVHVLHWVARGEVALHLFGPSLDLVGEAVPEGAAADPTPATRIFRWPVPPAVWTAHPAGQEGVAAAIDRAVWCFDWVAAQKVR